MQQRGELGLATLDRYQRAAGGNGQQLQRCGDGVFAIDLRGLNLKPADVARRTLALTTANGHALTRIDHHPLRVIGNAPGLQQRAQIRRLAVGHAFDHRFHALISLGERVNKGQQLAATQDELIDRVERRLAERFGVNQQQDLNILGNGVHILGQGFDFKHLTHLLQRDPRGLRLL